MSQYVADTHALIWHLYADPKLSPTCQTIFDRTDAGEDTIFVPSITLIEILYLAEKKRIPANAVETSIALIASEAENYQIAPLDIAVVQATQRIDRSAVPELPDRIIAATALSLGLPLMSRDLRIASVSGLKVIW
jgi:PIN domain nuclease of toxin-antitoxin system